MSEFVARLSWKLEGSDFAYENYSRNHSVKMGAGPQISLSAAPEFRGDASLPNPEELLIAALSSCHMLTFLAIAARKRLTVLSYDDAAVGVMSPNDAGRLFVSKVTLRPLVVFQTPPSVEIVRKLHHQAHIECFIANSVITQVTLDI